jgi:dienelactone hydrolase
MLAVLWQASQANDIAQFITPSGVLATQSEEAGSHLVLRREETPAGLLLVFLAGTGGRSDRGPKAFFRVALEQGYRVIDLAYIDEPAVAGVCNRRDDASDCAAHFRAKRAFGENVTNLIDDAPEDAIVSRLTALLRSLLRKEPENGWDDYLDGNGQVQWAKIALAGQSQGGGMAAFIAKRYKVARVVDFSGGWDMSRTSGKIASWYSQESATPPAAWYGAYHLGESMASTIEETYRALNIPEDHIFRFDARVDGDKKRHNYGVHNPANAPIWQKMLGFGA